MVAVSVAHYILLAICDFNVLLYAPKSGLYLIDLEWGNMSVPHYKLFTINCLQTKAQYISLLSDVHLSLRCFNKNGCVCEIVTAIA